MHVTTATVLMYCFCLSLTHTDANTPRTHNIILSVSLYPSLSLSLSLSLPPPPSPFLLIPSASSFPPFLRQEVHYKKVESQMYGFAGNQAEIRSGFLVIRSLFLLRFSFFVRFPHFRNSCMYFILPLCIHAFIIHIFSLYLLLLFCAMDEYYVNAQSQQNISNK